MKITMDDGTVYQVPQMICPRCYMDSVFKRGPDTDIRTENLLQVVKRQHARDGSKVEVRLCPYCEHKQYAVVDEWSP